MVGGAVADLFDTLISTLTDTRLEPNLEKLLWSMVNLCLSDTDRIERELHNNGQSQRSSQWEQGRSHGRSVELERLVAEGVTLIERDLSRLAATLPIDGRPSNADVGHDRQPRLPRRQTTAIRT